MSCHGQAGPGLQPACSLVPGIRLRGRSLVICKFRKFMLKSHQKNRVSARKIKTGKNGKLSGDCQRDGAGSGDTVRVVTRLCKE